MEMVKGMVLTCTVEGLVSSVIHDAWAVAKTDVPVMSLVHESDLHKCHLFIDTIARDGSAFGWEMHIGRAPMKFAGFMAQGVMFLVVTEVLALNERINEDLLAMQMELTNQLREAHKLRAQAQRDLVQKVEPHE